MRVLAVSGSLQSASSNHALLERAIQRAPEGITFVRFDGLRALPHFDPDLERDGAVPAVRAWREALTASDAVLIASPEYGHSLPGTLKNAIDWVIGTGELECKRVAITASVPGPERGQRGLDALRDTLRAVRATLVGGEPIVRGAGEDRALDALLRALIDAAP